MRARSISPDTRLDPSVGRTDLQRSGLAVVLAWSRLEQVPLEYPHYFSFVACISIIWLSPPGNSSNIGRGRRSRDLQRVACSCAPIPSTCGNNSREHPCSGDCCKQGDARNGECRRYHNLLLMSNFGRTAPHRSRLGKKQQFRPIVAPDAAPTIHGTNASGAATPPWEAQMALSHTTHGLPVQSLAFSERWRNAWTKASADAPAIRTNTDAHARTRGCAWWQSDIPLGLGPCLARGSTARRTHRRDAYTYTIQPGWRRREGEGGVFHRFRSSSHEPSVRGAVRVAARGRGGVGAQGAFAHLSFSSALR